MHLTETQINDFVDGTLNADELSHVHAHVTSCAQCRQEVDVLRALLARVGQLPTSIHPARDLRPQMWAQTDRRTLWHWRYPLAAAAVALIAITSIVTLRLTHSSEEVRISQQPAPAPASVDLVSIELQFSTELETLQRALRENREQLAPETVQILEENLRVIDSAIQEARSALARDPNSSTLGELLKSAYQRKLELLKQAARTSAAT